MKKEPKPLLIKKWHWILFISLLSFLLIAGGYFYYNYSANQIRDEEIQDLTTIAQLKINQIVQWHKARDGDAEVISGESFFFKGIGEWLQNKNNKILTTLIGTKLSQTQKAYGYEAIILSSVNGEVLLSVGSNLARLDKETSDRIIEAVKNREIVHTDFYYCNTEQKIHYDIVAPLIDDENKVVAVIVLRVDPSYYLYPLIQSWPTPSKTAETLLIRKEGNKVLFLNDLRFRDDIALKLEIPLTEKDVPSVQAVLGYKGIWEGIDYRGNKVLSYVNNIPGTNWFMVSKIDFDEIFSELKFRAGAIIIFIVLLISLLIASLTLIYHFRQRNIYRKLYTAQEGFKATLYSIGDAIITTDSNGKVQHLNLVAERMTGWSEAEAKGKKLEDVFKIINEETRNKVENPVKKVFAEGIVIGLANHTLLISKDGKEIPISDSGAPIKDETGKIAGVVLVFRDQSEERKNQKLIIDSETKYRRLFESAKDGIIIFDAETGKILDVNPFLVGMLGYSHKSFLEKTIWATGLFNHTDDSHNNFLKLQHKEYVRYDDLTLEKIDGQIINVEFVSNAYLVDNKKIIQCNIRDITQRKHAEETLRVSEEKFKNVFEHSVVGKSLTGMDGSLRTNESYSKILGYSEVELSNIKWQQITYPEDIENDKKMINSLISGEKESARWEKRYIHKSGKIIWVDIGSVLQRDKTGKPLYFNTAIYDITERKKAEEALLYSQNLIQGIIDNSPSLIYLLDLDGKFILINKILEKVLALPKEKILGNTRQVFMPEEIAKQHRKNDLTVITSKLSYTFEEENVESDEKHFYLTQKFPLFDSDGKVFAIGGISTDITERKQAEEELNNLSMRQSAILDSVPDIIMEVNTNKIYTWANSAGIEFFGDDVIGKEAAYYFEGEQDTYANVQPIFNGSGNIIFLESLQRRKDGEIRLLAWWCRALKDQNGNVIGVLSAAQDVTERERAENAVRESEKFLKETQKIAQLGSYSLDVNTGVWKSSEILDSVFGIEPDFDKSVQGWTSIIHPEWQQLMAEYFTNEVVGLKKPFDKEYKIIRMNDKAERWVHGLGELVFDIENHPVKMIGTIRDITERINTEQEILRLNRVYALLSNTNQAIVRIKDKQKLFDEICRIAIEDGKFRMAWIGIINHSTDKVDVVSSAGLRENYLENINIDLGDETRYYGPTGKAIKNGTHFFSNDIENDKNMQPWKESALKLGYKSSAAFPLKVFGDVIGVFSIYANQKDFFHENEIRLLVEMAMDISFALEFLETEKIRIKTEENLYQSEERFRSLYENSTIGLYRTTPGGKILLANPTLIEMLGYSSFEELATRDLEKDGFESTSERKDFSDAIEITGEVKGFESAWTRRDGTIIYVLESAKSIRDSKGQTLYYDGTVEDITEKRKAEAALRESELRFKQVSESAHEWIWEVDNNGLYTYVSPVIEELLGYKAEEIIGIKYFYDFFEPQNREEMKQAALAAFVRKERFKDFTNVNIHKDGRKVILSTTGFPVLNDENCLIGYRGVDVDITERKQAEDELLASKLFIEEIINSIPVRVFWKDKNLVYLGCNNLFAHDAGLSDPKEIIGKDDYQMSWRDQAEFYRNDDRNVIESGGSKILFEESQTTPEGKTITLLTSKIPLQNSGGEIVGILGTYLDITDRKIAESELIASKEKAEEMNRLKSNFLANMSHELRTPLVGILGYADILRQDVELPEIKTMAETIYKSGTRLSETLNLILDLSKFETEKMNIKYQKVDIVTRTKEIINLFNEIAQKKGLSLLSSFSEDSIIIDFEERAFHSILNNLINNAIKFTFEGSVTTTISLNNDFVEIKVIDTGIGIAEQDYQNIFEEFHQVSEGYDRNFEGSGLGLSITKKLVEKFGGTITVNSEIGKGTSFKVILPVTIPEAKEEEIPAAETKIIPQLLKRKSVKPIALLVDDDPFVFTVLKRYASEYIELETTVDADFAIKMLKKKQYDLIFMDINLRRGLDGKQITKKIRTMVGYESIPIIATTAYAMEGDKEEFLAAGCTHYLSKPFSKAEIAELLEKLLKLV